MALNQDVFYNSEFQLKDYIASGKSHVIGRDYRKTIASSTGLPTIGSGSQQRFTISGTDEGSKMLRNVTLVVEASAITKTGGTYVSFIDGVLLAMLNDTGFCIEVWQNGNKILQTTQQTIRNLYKLMNDSDEADVVNLAVGYDSQANRRANSAAAQTFYLEFDEFFSLLGRPFPVFLLQNQQMEVVINWSNRTASGYVETDGTSPSFSITKAHLLCTYVQPGQGVLANVLSEASAPQGFLGFQYGYEHYIRSDSAGTATSYEYQLGELSGKDILGIVFTCRTAANAILPSGYNTNVAIASWSLKKDGNYIHGYNADITAHLWEKRLLTEYNLPGKAALVSENLYGIFYSPDVAEAFKEREQKFHGCENFRGVDNARITFNFDSAPGAAIQFDIILIMAQRISVKPGKINILA